MKTRFHRLTRAQKIVLLVTVLLVLVFTVLYPLAFFQQGNWYGGSFLTFSQNRETVTYTGRVEGEPLTITVDGDKTISTQWGDVRRGPYTVREDPTALPQEAWGGMTGVEVREGDNLLLRGGWQPDMDAAMTQDGRLLFSAVSPFPADILRLWSGPVLVRRANIGWYFPGLLLAVLGILSLLFAEELFRWNLSWQISDPDSAEPTGWEIGRRTVYAALFALLALVCWIMGLVNT